MVDWKFIFEITKKLCILGRKERSTSSLQEVEPFKHYYNKEGELEYDDLDEYDGQFTRREILTRYILVSIVLDQGPDMAGVEQLLKDVTTQLYRQEVRIFHRPIDFFKELGISIDEIITRHESVKSIRADEWAERNSSSPSKYNLFFTSSPRGVVPAKQVLSYAIHRWGVPLCVPLLLEKDLQKSGKSSPQPLVDYLESWSSAETMSSQLKSNERYGLGDAIGDKACHLFAKKYLSIFKLVKHKLGDDGWTDISYESPLDSNAGRVLFRTGFLLEFASLKKYKDHDVIQKGRGKGGGYYIRVTNIRGMKTSKVPLNSDFFQDYVNIVVNYLKIGSRSPRSIEIQRLSNTIIYELLQKKHTFSIADFDDGLMNIGTNYCSNDDKPKCNKCPINDLCIGYNSRKDLIVHYKT